MANTHTLNTMSAEDMLTQRAHPDFVEACHQRLLDVVLSPGSLQPLSPDVLEALNAHNVAEAEKNVARAGNKKLHGHGSLADGLAAESGIALALMESLGVPVILDADRDRKTGDTPLFEFKDDRKAEIYGNLFMEITARPYGTQMYHGSVMHLGEDDYSQYLVVAAGVPNPDQDKPPTRVLYIVGTEVRDKILKYGAENSRNVRSAGWGSSLSSTGITVPHEMLCDFIRDSQDFSLRLIQNPETGDYSIDTRSHSPAPELVLEHTRHIPVYDTETGRDMPKEKTRLTGPDIAAHLKQVPANHINSKEALLKALRGENVPPPKEKTKDNNELPEL